jgi:hypothetical protein
MSRVLLTFKQFLKESDNYAFDADSSGDASDEYQPQHRESKKARKKREQEEAQKMAPQPQHGFQLSPEHSQQISNLISKEFDDPDTAEIEKATNATWQTVNTAAQNAVQRQVQKLKAQHGMAY